MPAYTHRERVLTTFQHQPVDCIPMDMMGNATMILDRTDLRLRDYLKLTPIPPARSGSTANYYDERYWSILILISAAESHYYRGDRGPSLASGRRYV